MSDRREQRRAGRSTGGRGRRGAPRAEDAPAEEAAEAPSRGGAGRGAPRPRTRRRGAATEPRRRRLRAAAGARRGRRGRRGADAEAAAQARARPPHRRAEAPARIPRSAPPSAPSTRAKAAAARTRSRARARTKHEPGQGTPPAERAPGSKKVRQGTVVSSKADKTITVRIEVVRRHPVYEKVVRRTATIHAHDEANDANAGDVVRVIESRPLSRTKRWRLVEVLERAR